MSLRILGMGLAVLVSVSVILFQGVQGSNETHILDNSKEAQAGRKCSFRVVSWGQERIVLGTCEKNGCCANPFPNSDREKTCLGFCTKLNPSGACPQKCRNTGIKSAFKFDLEEPLEPEPERGRCFPVGNGHERGCACGVSYPDLDIIPQTICPPPKVSPQGK